MSQFSDEKLDRIVESLQQVNVNLESLRVSLVVIGQTSEDHEQRIRSVEQWKHLVTPLLAALTFAMGAVFSVTLEKLF